MNRRSVLLVLLTVLLPACASMRKVSVGSDTASFGIDVYNSHSSTLTVSYTDTHGTHQLGTVSAGRTERFVIPGGASTSVTIQGTTSGGTAYTKSVSLGSTTKVTL